MDGFDYNVNTSSEGDVTELASMKNSDFISDVGCVLLDSEEHILRPVVPMTENRETSSFLSPMNDFLSDNDNFSRNVYFDQPIHVPDARSFRYSGHSTNSYIFEGQENSDIGLSPLVTDMAEMKYATIDSFENVGYNLHGILPPNEFGIDSSYPYTGTEPTSNLNEFLLNSEQGQGVSYSQNNGKFNSDSEIKCKMNYEAASDSSSKTTHFLKSNVAENYINNNSHTQLLENFNDAFQKSHNISLLPTNSTKCTDDVNNFYIKEIGLEHSPKQEVEMEQIDTNFEKIENLNEFSLPNQNALTLPVVGTPTFTNNKSSLSNEMNFSQSMKDVPEYRYMWDLYKNRAQWTSLLQKKHFIPPPDLVIMHPLRTRKLSSSRRLITGDAGQFRDPNSQDCDVKFELSNTLTDNADKMEIKSQHQHFTDNVVSKDLPDISSTTTFSCAPYVNKHSKNVVQGRTRRKQKLHVIPGSEHMVFEIDQEIKINAEDPYPEVELPELDEIFRRKKRSNTSLTCGNKRTLQRSASNTSVTKRLISCDVSDGQSLQLDTVPETSTSFDAKISISLRKEKTHPINGKNDLMYSSDSDLEENVEPISCEVATVKSLKCSKCKKIFKSTRSLAIHTRRCNSLINTDASNNTMSHILNEKQKFDGNYSGGVNNDENNKKQNNFGTSEKSHSECIAPICKKSNDMVLKDISLDATVNGNQPRPITRSQTRQSFGQSYFVAKRSKLFK